MISALHGLESVGLELARRARAAGVMLIWRAQTRNVHRVLVRRGKVEGTSVHSTAGHGVQVVTPEGRTALGSRDDLKEEEALALLERVVRTAGQAEALGLTAEELPALEPVHGRALPDTESFGRIRLDQVGQRLAELEAEILARVPGAQLSLSFHAEVDAWRIMRSDGTDVLFAMPRCTLGAHATNEGDGQRHGVSASLFSPSPDLPWDERCIARFVKRAERAARLARDLPDAPNHPAGSHPLLIDYALAKGLAHEAFGHACEADGYRSSVLAREGRFRAGDVVGADHVSIIDEPLERDHAWQPYSANGVRRERATLVRGGRLVEGLSDIWSAGPGGVRLTGAARAESFHHAPQARMSNIRLEVADPLPAPGEFEDYNPERVRDLLASAGVFERHPRVVFLSGYSGGQVNPTSGDFVFNCKAIYVLSRDGLTFHKPAIFSGSMFAALHAVREAFGPLILDALGHCGKWGQSVPSSGGSHYFLLLEPDPKVRLGGAEVRLDRFLEALAASQPGGPAPQAWSVYASESRGLSLGIKDREVGNAHVPLKLGETCGARYRLVWDDGKVSRGYVERRLLEGNPVQALANARAAAYSDPDAAHVAGPAALADVELCDSGAAAVAGGEVALLVSRLDSVRRCVDAGGFRTWSGSFSAGHARSRIVSSSGLDASSEGTSIGWHVTFNGEAGDGHSARAPESEESFTARLDRLTRTAELLEQPARAPAAGTRPIVLHPHVVESYVLGTLLSNLSGATVAHGEGHFRREQFGSDRPVLREDLGFRIDPLAPLKSGSYRYTTEGVPAAPCAFLERGRLLRPVLDMKYARRLGLAPTPLPSDTDTMHFEGPPPLPLEAALSRAVGGAVVLSVLGIHTQDSASGDFSLSAPQAFVVGPGGLAGRMRGTISGNLFDLLSDDGLQFVRFEGEHTPGLLVSCRLDPQ